MTDAKAEAPAAAGTKLPPAIATIFMTRCGTCHNSEYGNATMAYTRLKGMAGAPCSRPRMTPGDGRHEPGRSGHEGHEALRDQHEDAARQRRRGAQPQTSPTVEEWITAGAMGVP